MIKAIIIVSPFHAPSVFTPEVIDAIKARVKLVCEPISREEVEAQPALLQDVEVVFSSWGPPALDACFIKSAPRLRVVFHAAGSVKHFISEAMWERGVRISSAWAINGQVVAEYTLGAILFSLKQGFAYAMASRQNRRVALQTWPVGISGSTVALISLGAAGRAVLEKIQSYDLRVIAYDPWVTAEEAGKLGVTLVSLEEAFSRAEVVSLHTPLNAATATMIRGKHFASMRPHATFINTARGGLVHEAEMLGALRSRPDIVAILDVTEPEPPAADSPLYELPNVILTPHIAGAVGRDCVRLGRCMVEEFDRWTTGRPLLWEIKRERLSELA